MNADRFSNVDKQSRALGHPSGRILALDGLRGIAVLAVLFFHLRIPGSSLGWAGVPLFFVLSGFLITGILLDSKDQAFFFRNFYIRRALRIFPLYFLVVILTILVSLHARAPDIRHWQIFFLYIQNYYFPLYGTKSHFLEMLVHTWSLAVEEQFYLLWPFIVFVLPKKPLAISCCFLILVALVFRFYMFQHQDITLYMGYMALPAQVDGLALGALVAILLRIGMTDLLLKRIGLLSILICLGLLLPSVLLIGAGKFWSLADWTVKCHGMACAMSFSIITLMDGIFAGAVLLAALGSRSLCSLLTLKPLRYTGQISYGIYLYHPAVYELAKYLFIKFKIPFAGMTLTRLSLVLLVIIVTYMVASLSFFLFESKLLALKSRLTRSDGDFDTTHDKSRKLASSPP